MKIEKLSALAEIVASIAIVVTLVYLAIETRQNTDAIHASTRQGMAAAEIQLLLGRAENPSRAIALCKEQITREEAYSIQSELIAIIRMREHDWLQVRSGVLDERTWETYRNGLIVNLEHPRARAFWDAISVRSFDPEFVAQVNDYLSEANIPQDASVLCDPIIQ